jgi:two-component system, NarL family, nitrate/nitrite response regulator NarL
MRALGTSPVTVVSRDGDDSWTAGCTDGFRPARGRVLVVEEHALVAVGLQVALSERRWDVETSGPSAQDLVDHTQRFQPHCVLVNVHLPNGVSRGVELIAPLAATGAPVVVLSAERRRAVLAECLEAGAVGWISSAAGLDEVDATLSRVVAGSAIIGRTERAELLERLRMERASAPRVQATFEALTQREALVLAALSDGLSAEEIARGHFVALSTVRSQIRSVLQKLGVRSQLAAVAMASSHRELLPDVGETARDRRRPAVPSRRRGADVTAHIA